MRTASSPRITRAPAAVDRHGVVARRQIDEARREERAQDAHDVVLRFVGEKTERGEPVEPETNHALGGLAAQHFGDRLGASPAPRPGDRGERLADDDRVALEDLGIVAQRLLDLAAHVAVTTAAERLGLVTEVAQDEVVPARRGVDVAQELAKERPRSLDLRVARGAAVAAELAETAAQAGHRPGRA